MLGLFVKLLERGRGETVEAVGALLGASRTRISRHVLPQMNHHFNIRLDRLPTTRELEIP